MKRSELEKFLGKRVKVTLFDGDIFEGTLSLGNGYFEVPKYYHIKEKQICFRCSHVVKLEEMK